MWLAAFAAILLALLACQAAAAAPAPKVTVTGAGVGCGKKASLCVTPQPKKVTCRKGVCLLPVRVRAARSGTLVVAGGRAKATRFREGASRVRVAYRQGMGRVRVKARLDRLVSAQGGDVRYSVPATTQLVAGSRVVSVTPGAKAGQLIVVLAGKEPPAPGGHLALAPANGLPDGMFARVVAVNDAPGDRHRVTVTSAAISDALDGVRIDVDQAVTPEVAPNLADVVTRDRSGALTYRLGATFAQHGRAGSHAAPWGAFTCRESGGIPRTQDQVWTTGLPFPINLTIENVRVNHVFDAGSFFPSRKPYLLLQLSAEAVAKVGFEAKTGFKCQLSDSFRSRMRITMPIAVVAGIPIKAYLEPRFEFEVSASGEVTFTQRRYFGVKIEKVGFDPVRVSRSGSADPVDVQLSAKVEVSLFAGGELSVMAGAGVEAGIFGALGPEFRLVSDTANPACAAIDARLRAELGARLSVWEKRWNLEAATLTSDWLRLGGPWCSFRGGGGGGGVGGQPTPPGTPAPRVVSTSDGACALISDGRVRCRGNNQDGMVGNGSVGGQFDPWLGWTTVVDINDATQISTGDGHRCAVRQAGGVSCWGDNGRGELGRDPETHGSSGRPLAVPGVTGVRQVAAGDSFACALRSNGTAVCWGDNTSGQAGAGIGNPNGDLTEVPPSEVVGLTEAVQIAAGNDHACAVRAGGSVVCWGSNQFGQLGRGTAGDSTVPVSVPGLTGVAELTAGAGHTCARRTNGSVACWGSGWLVGDGGTTDRFSPVEVTGLSNVIALSAGSYHTCALRQGGTVMCWGRNDDGQTGDMTETHRLDPVQAVASGVASLDATYASTYAVRTDGSIVMWGQEFERLNWRAFAPVVVPHPI
ncbi:MAG: RCC1 domain-containing protein [Thermoleophilia bacterium]